MVNTSTDERIRSGPFVGLGLRHAHYGDVLKGPAEIDFVEVHAENFSMDGGLALSLLEDVGRSYPISIHATSLGLASNTPIPESATISLKRLVDKVNPILLSDHAAFSWSADIHGLRHSGDLLPFEYSDSNLDVFVENIERVQQTVGRRLNIENLSSYLSLPGSTMQEFEFLQAACLRTGAGLLVDINNLYVNAVNALDVDPLDSMKRILDGIDPVLVGEIHLAGCREPKPGGLMVDDHSQHVTSTVWHGYQYALRRFGHTPTLIEWDNDLPAWSVLLGEAAVARELASMVEER